MDWWLGAGPALFQHYKASHIPRMSFSMRLSSSSVPFCSVSARTLTLCCLLRGCLQVAAENGRYLLLFLVASKMNELRLLLTPGVRGAIVVLERSIMADAELCNILLNVF